MALLAIPAVLVASTAHASAASATFNVLDYGAVGDGVTDNTAAFAAAIKAAEASDGGTIVVPSGVYAFTAVVPGGAPTSIATHGSYPINIEGTGRASTKLVEHVPGQVLLGVRTDGAVISGLSLDARTYDGGIALNVQANYTTVEYDRVLGQSSTPIPGSGVTGKFAIYYQGQAGSTPEAPIYSVGNVVNNLVLRDGIQNDGFSFSFQKDATISNVDHIGSRLALYMDSNVTVTDYNYTPNPRCGGSANGFFITAPSDHITIDGFTSSGSGGVIGGAGQAAVSSDVVINNEVLTTPAGEHLTVGNVDGLDISGLNLGASNTVVVDSPNVAHQITVENSTVPQVEFAEWGGHQFAEADLAFTNVTMPAFAPGGVPGASFWHMPVAGPVSIVVNAGEWSNALGGFARGTGMTFSGSGVPAGA